MTHEEQRGTAPGGGAPTAGRVRVLLVDDQPLVADEVRRMLEEDDVFALTYCADPRNAIATALGLEPSVILQDLIMPGMDGLLLARLFKAHPRLSSVPLVVLSSEEDPFTKARALELGADDYLVKLPDRLELVARLRRHALTHRLRRERDAAHAALEEAQRRTAVELAQASRYVRSLLPPPLTEGPVLADWTLLPCSTLGGDTLGYHRLGGGRLAAYLLDVSGHGVGPALLSVSALDTIRSESLAGADYGSPASVLAALNEVFQMDRHDELYFTIWYGVLDAAARRLTWAGAGHPAPLLVGADGGVRELETQNPFIGIRPGTAFEESAKDLALPASLYVFSDGVVEVGGADGATWGKEGLRQAVAARPTADEVYTLARAFRGQRPLEDDFSLLHLTVLGE